MGKIAYLFKVAVPYCSKKETPNQEVHGPQHSLEKSVQINKQTCSMLWLYHYIELERGKPIISYLIFEWSFNLWNLQSPSPNFVPSLVEIGPMVLEEKIFKLGWCIFAISWLPVFPFRKWHDPLFEQAWIPFTQGCFEPSLAEIGPVVLEKGIFKFHQCISAI